MPRPVYEPEDVTVLWNQAVHTDREVTANGPDIIRNKKDKTCLLMGVAVHADRNVVQKETEKKLKCKILVFSIFHALIRVIKYINNQQMHFNLNDVLLFTKSSPICFVQ